MEKNIKMAKILLVDDQQANIDVLHDFLEIHGYENIMATTDSRNIVKLLAEFSPDIILLDLAMPYLNGFEIMKHINSVVDPKDYLPILVLTADVTIESKRKALQYGASDFLTKPFDMIELQARVNTHLQIRFKNEQIKEYAQALETLIATKNKFFSIIAHDIRNPFVGIENYIQILLKIGKYDVQEIENHLKTIYSTAHHGHELLENLLKWSRSQTGTIVINNELFMLSTAVNNCSSFIRNQAENKNIILNIDIPEGIMINSDKDILETILRNLLSNAVKFTPLNGSVTIKAEINDLLAILSITDTGIGISEANRGKLFKIDSKLQSEKGTTGEKGSGLGLILCKEFTDKLMGKISYESEIGKGTTFTISIPHNT